MKVILATMRGALAEALANRTAFWAQFSGMIANDIVWVIFWVLFFRRVDSVRGWDSSRVMLLLAVLTTCAGLVLGVLANVRKVGRMAAAGELDAVLALPVSPLAHLLVKRIEVMNLGDVAFGLVLFSVAGAPSFQRTLVYVVGVLAGAVLLTGFIVGTGSLAFFARSGEAGEFSVEATLLLAAYPVDIFTGATKALLYTAVPAAFVAAVPAGLIDSFDVGRALMLLGAAAAFGFGGWLMFTLGLKRYSSGSVWTRA